MRARLALKYSGMTVVLREILLRDKPDAFLTASKSTTVPVLELRDGRVIEKSLDIMFWALQEAGEPAGGGCPVGLCANRKHRPFWMSLTVSLRLTLTVINMQVVIQQTLNQP